MLMKDILDGEGNQNTHRKPDCKWLEPDTRKGPEQDFNFDGT